MHALNHAPTAPPVSIRALADRYLTLARYYYRRRDGSQTREHLNHATTLKRLCTFTGDDAPASRLNRHQLRAWLDQLAAEGLTRGYINATLSRVRRFARWCVDLDYLPAAIADELQAVRPLPAHRSAAREPSPRAPASLADARLAIALLPAIPRDVCQLIMLTGARLSEILAATSADVRTDAPGPRLQPARHKCAHRGTTRVIPLSAQAMTIIDRRWRPICPQDALFPAPRSTLTHSYSADALRAALKRACLRAGVQAITPHQLRHAVAAQVRDHHGLDHAAALLGHAHVRMTEHYAPLTYTQARLAAEVLQ